MVAGRGFSAAPCLTLIFWTTTVQDTFPLRFDLLWGNSILSNFPQKKMIYKYLTLGDDSNVDWQRWRAAKPEESNHRRLTATAFVAVGSPIFSRAPPGDGWIGR